MVNVHTYITYHDIFTLALAKSSMKRFNPDIDKWHKAVFEIWEKYKNEVPEFARIYFADDRPPLPPMSDQVYSLRSVLARSGEMRMYPGIKNKIIKREEARLARYKVQIEDMAKIFKKHLSVHGALN